MATPPPCCPEFLSQIDAAIGPLLHQLGYGLEESREVPGDGCDVRYRSDRWLIRIFLSHRDGDVNCRVSSDLRRVPDEEKTWEFIRAAVGWRADWTLAELLADPPPPFRSNEEILRELGGFIRRLSSE